MLNAPLGYEMTYVVFASYGTPTGICGSYWLGGCHATGSMQAVNATCFRKTNCVVPSSYLIFGDPCDGIYKHLYIEIALGIYDIYYL